MERGWTFLSVGTGAGLMYLLDPDRGRRRRALLRDKAIHATHEARRALGLASRDLVNRSRGVVAGVRHKIERGDADDDVLVERIRARIGHVVSHPHAVRVECDDGMVGLSGPILGEEVEGCVEAVEAVPGVRAVEACFDIHEDADIPALRGGPRRMQPRGKMHPTPGQHLAIASSALASMLWGGRRGGFLGGALRGAGILMILAELAGTETVQELVADLRARAGVRT